MQLTGEETQSDKTTLRLASDVRQALKRWAAVNVSNMTAEVNRAIRERMEREAEKAAG